MSSWFDRLLEELEQRQREADARREGRPIPPRQPRESRESREPRNVTPMRRRRGGDGADGPGGPEDGAGGSGGWSFPTGGGAIPIRRYVVIGLVVVGILIAVGLAGGLVALLTDLAWYDALGRREILTTRLWAQVGLFAVGFAAFAIPALASIWIARRIAPQAPVRRLGWLDMPDASRALLLGLSVVALVLALGSANDWRGHWEAILLWANGTAWGVSDPTFERDIGFYVFDLPWWRFLAGWGTSSLITIGLLTLGAYAAGALRWQFRLSAPVRAHLSIIGAGLLLILAAGYQLDIAELAYATRGIGGSIQAALYTDVNAQLPALVILTVVAVGAAALLLLNTWFRTLWLILAAGAAWVVVAILVGGLYPNVVQTLQVNPNEIAVERPYIANHISATRAAFDLDAIEQRSFTGEQELTRPVFAADQPTIDNLRLWDYRPLLTTFGQQQILRRYYTFTDVDIDRYEIGGEQRQIMLSARELDVERLADQARTWTNERLVFTHGYGITAVPVDAVTPQGQPDYLVSGINREPQLPVGEPRIYFGETTDTYVVTGTDTDEFDFPLEESEEGAVTTWDGTTGVGVDNIFSRLLFAIRFGDLNLLISNQLTDESQILFRRQITERVREIAPFLAYDGDPYLVSADEGLAWIWDAYTVTNRYPHAQPLASGPLAGANYVRNSVKVVVDAYNGSVRFFLTDPDEPIIAAYARIFPGLFEPMEAMPDSLRSHLRYPEDLFTAQNAAYLLYHLPATEAGATTFYNQDDRWAFPDDVSTGTGEPMEPYYVVMRIPGEEAAEFTLIQPLVAERRPNMIAWVAARMAPEVYGERIAFRFPNDTSTQGPAQVEARIDQDDTISAQFSLWNRSGSSVIRGNLLVLPVGEDGLFYVEPIFLQAEGAPFPEFVRVIMVSQERVAFAETVEDGLRQLLGEAPIPPPEEEPPEEPPDGETPPDGELPSDAAGLVEEAQRLYDEAQEALADGDLGTYQARIDELESVLEALVELTGASPDGSPDAEPSPSASP